MGWKRDREAPEVDPQLTDLEGPVPPPPGNPDAAKDAPPEVAAPPTPDEQAKDPGAVYVQGVPLKDLEDKGDGDRLGMVKTWRERYRARPGALMQGDWEELDRILGEYRGTGL